ncbi:MAG: hypothetical protein R3255_02060 [Candidatus Lokiarchaeia archaeon]|nr:hypothetical protein [Candidatus Lokiarchaeia archaeon]
MDFKDFHDGLLSISLIIFIFSITLMITSIVLNPFIGGQSEERDLIIILSSINILFSLYYIWNVIKLEKVFSLETKNIIRFAKEIGIITLIYLPHVVLYIFLLFQNLNNLEFLMIVIIIFMEIFLIGVVLKEVYDILFIEESQRDTKIEIDRKKYIETRK